MPLCRQERPRLFSEVVILPSYSLFCQSKTHEGGDIFEAGFKPVFYLGHPSSLLCNNINN